MSNNVMGNFINNQIVGSTSSRQAKVFNPATGDVSLQVSLSTAEETQGAIAAAQTAFETWSQVTPLNRARVLFKFKALVEEHSHELAELISS
jgi:malonate-semialdehyde dehydrogenase (acetylating) / methylmalonate-semialdehyde dehydrogenase